MAGELCLLHAASHPLSLFSLSSSPSTGFYLTFFEIPPPGLVFLHPPTRGSQKEKVPGKTRAHCAADLCREPGWERFGERRIGLWKMISGWCWEGKGAVNALYRLPSGR